MKKTIFTLFLIFAGFTFSHSQTIEAQKVFGGYKYTQNGNILSPNELTTQLNTNKESAELLKKAKSRGTIASILAGAGGALVGYPLGTAIGGGEPNWVLAGVGAGIIAVAIPISSGANKKAKEAVDLYNARINTKENLAYKPQLFTLVNGHGIGLALQL